MARTLVRRLAFNRGLISRLGLARGDVPRARISAEIHSNWIPRVLGSMSLRPGFQFLTSTKSDAKAVYIDFVFSVSDKALLEFTSGIMRVWINDALLSRVSVSSLVTNGNFTSDLTGWTDNDEAGAVSVFATGGFLSLQGDTTATNAAIRDQQVTVAAADQNKEHALRVVIERGPVSLRVGSTSGADDFIAETVLATGTHSLAFTPTGDFHIRLFSRLSYIVLVDSCNVEASGVVEITSPYLLADLPLIRWDSSGDLIFLSRTGFTQRIIERRSTTSWSLVQYLSDDGPLRVQNVGPVTLTPSALLGEVTLTASKDLFKSTHGPSANNAGALFRISSNGQTVTANVTAQNQFTNTIRVTGVGANRVFTLTRAGTWVATVTLQRSLTAETGPFEDVAPTFTTNGTISHDDSLDNQIAWYRIGVKTGGFTSGTVELTLDYPSGSILGVGRVSLFTSSNVVTVQVLKNFGSLTASALWSEGEWSDFRGWPSAVSFGDGRLWWGGRSKAIGSISDAFFSFDPEVEGDSGVINRSIGSGPIDNINWILELQRLILGGDSTEFSIRSSSLDEPLTPTNFNIKPASRQGSAMVAAAKIDSRGIFVQRGGSRVYELSFGENVIDYESTDLTAFVPEIGLPGIVKIAVQRQPDTRLHCIRSDGTVAMMIFDKVENVIAWIDIETDGLIEDVVILPGDDGQEEDSVYYSVQRTINSVVKTYLEKWAFETASRGGVQNKQADSFILYNQAGSSTISGLGHLEAKSVVVWDNGKCLVDVSGDIATFVVSEGSIIVTNNGTPVIATVGVVGLQYTASFLSSKLVELMVDSGATLTDEQKISGLALLLADVHAKGLKFGGSLVESEMNDLPEVAENGTSVGVDDVRASLVTKETIFPDGFSNDSRIALLAKAPRPATVLAALADVEHHG